MVIKVFYTHIYYLNTLIVFNAHCPQLNLYGWRIILKKTKQTPQPCNLNGIRTMRESKRRKVHKGSSIHEYILSIISTMHRQIEPRDPVAWGPQQHKLKETQLKLYFQYRPRRPNMAALTDADHLTKRHELGSRRRRRHRRQWVR